jgi:hypothetical protein
MRLTEKAARLSKAVEEGVIDPGSTELIVVDDGSTDETGYRAEELLAPAFSNLRVLRLPENSGKGAAIRTGATAAAAQAVIFLDADMSVDPAQIPLLVSALGPADVAIGSRCLASSTVESHNFQRKLMGRTFNLLVSSLTHLPFKDTQCGFKAFRTPAARILFHLMTVERFAFDVEVLSLARRLHMHIAEVPVQWREVRESTVRMLRDPLSMTRDVLGVRQRRQWPQLPALTVTAGLGERRRSQTRIVSELDRALGPNYPILSLSENQSLVLLPLCNPIEVQETAHKLKHLPTKLTVRERSVSLAQLVGLAPFKWLSAETSPSSAVRSLVNRSPHEAREFSLPGSEYPLTGGG